CRWQQFTQLLCWVFYCALCWSFFSCENKKEDIDLLISEDNVKMDKADSVTFLYSEQGNVKARLYATHFERNERLKPVYMDLKGGLYVEFFNDSLQIDNTLRAKTARYYEEAGNVLIRDSIVVLNKKGEELQTEELVWNQKLKKFYTDKPVSIKTPTQIL